jgi:hypothetical protein
MKRAGCFLIWSLMSMLISACQFPLSLNSVHRGQPTIIPEQTNPSSLNGALSRSAAQPTLMTLWEDLALQKSGMRSEFAQDVETYAAITKYWITVDVDFDRFFDLWVYQGGAFAP